MRTIEARRICTVIFGMGVTIHMLYACDGDDTSRPATTIPMPTTEAGMAGAGGSAGLGGTSTPGAGGGSGVDTEGGLGTDAANQDVSVTVEAGAGGTNTTLDASPAPDGTSTTEAGNPGAEAGLVCDPNSGSYDNTPILALLPGGALPAMP